MFYKVTGFGHRSYGICTAKHDKLASCMTANTRDAKVTPFYTRIV